MAPDPSHHHGIYYGDDFMKMRNRKTMRNREIYDLRKAGVTYRQIAEKFDISICRVRQIIDAERANVAAGINPTFDWNEWNRQNMETLAARLKEEAAKEQTDEVD